MGFNLRWRGGGDFSRGAFIGIYTVDITTNKIPGAGALYILRGQKNWCSFRGVLFKVGGGAFSEIYNRYYVEKNPRGYINFWGPKVYTVNIQISPRVLLNFSGSTPGAYSRWVFFLTPGGYSIL